MYGYKPQVSALPNGIPLAGSYHDLGSMSDLNMFRSMAHFHRRATKNEHESLTPDHGPLRTLCPINLAILTDKGYKGAADILRVLSPMKKPTHGRLFVDDERSTAELSSDRVVVENFFGRQSSLWAIIGSKFTWSESCYDSIFQFSVALTNLHIGWHALRKGDIFCSATPPWRF